MDQLPIIRDPGGHFSSDCCPPPGGQKELHMVHRTVAVRAITNSQVGDVLQDEEGIPILDEVTNTYIFDDLKA